MFLLMLNNNLLNFCSGQYQVGLKFLVFVFNLIFAQSYNACFTFFDGFLGSLFSFKGF